MFRCLSIAESCASIVGAMSGDDASRRQVTRIAHSGERRVVPGQPLVTSYAICTNPRSGSWLLSEGLAATNVAGNPREWFNLLEEKKLRAQWPVTTPYVDYVDYVLRIGATSNGVRGIKIHYYQLAYIAQMVGSIENYQGLPINDLIASMFPGIRYIWLTRLDKSRQAISNYRAVRTGQWWLLDETQSSPRAADGQETAFDPQAIASLERRLVVNDLEWQSFFLEYNIDPLKVTYEDLAADYAGTIARVVSWLGISHPDVLSIPRPRLKRQSDSQSEEWLQRYLRFKMSEEHSDMHPGTAQ